ncbi:MAG: ABC transporter substrate-binding protein, partial [Myxococcota bacterium]|nr:ABC transporter substrate-binding protein [Myxococcota bacterium]
PGGPAPRAVLVVDRTPDDLRQFFVAGSDNFLSDLLAAAGARNAFDGARSAFPHVSLEPILAADPDLLIELAPGASAAEVADRLGTWRRLAPGMRAVRNGSVRVLTDRTLPVPGPGIGAAVRALAAVVDAARRAEGDAR